MIARPSVMAQIIPHTGTRVAKVLVGPRGSGKSTMLKLVAARLLRGGAPRSTITHLDLASARAADIHGADALASRLRGAIDRAGPDGAAHLFVDNVRAVDGWQEAVRALLDTRRADMYVAGTGPWAPDGTGGTNDGDGNGTLDGRLAVIDVPYLSFAEFLPAWRDEALPPDGADDDGIRGTGGRDAPSTRTDGSAGTDVGAGTRAGTAQDLTADAFDAYLAQGGLPFQTALAFDPAATLHYATDLTDAALLRDAMTAVPIRDAALLARTLRHVAATSGGTVTVASIVAALRGQDRQAGRTGRRPSPETIASHLDAFARARLIDRIRDEDPATGRRFKIGGRIRLADPSIRSALAGIPATPQARRRAAWGVVAGELLRRGWRLAHGRPATPAARGVDLIARRGADTMYVQVIATASPGPEVDAAFDALAALRDNWPKLVLALDGAPAGRGGIAGMRAADWLLADGMA